MSFFSTAFLILSLALVTKNVLCRPTIDDDYNSLMICYSLNCPEGTNVCGKHSEISSEDKTKLNVQLKCYDEDGNILKVKNSTEDNPFGPNVYYKGTRLSAVIKMRPTDLYGSDLNTKDTKMEHDNNPFFLNIPNYPTSKSGPKSEVEDLTNR